MLMSFMLGILSGNSHIYIVDSRTDSTRTLTDYSTLYDNSPTTLKRRVLVAETLDSKLFVSHKDAPVI